MVLFSTAYLPPISYIKEFVKSEQIFIEYHEHYIKQTYRNRAEIYGANGILALSIPVEHKNLFTIPIREVKISSEQPWQRIHWRSIESAYRNSPYFEYYEEELKPFYKKNYQFLIEWNQDILLLLLKLLGVSKEISFTESYNEQPDNTDLRNKFLPGSGSFIPPEPYTQVFSEKHGFIPDLSIIDLLFNEGPKASQLIQADKK